MYIPKNLFVKILLIMVLGIQVGCSSTPPLDIGSTQISKMDGMTQMYVPAGTFTMGSDTNDGDEKPAHIVTLNAFWIDQTEVTNRMYALCVKAGACLAPSQTNSYTRASYYGNPQYNNYPVINMSWDDANTYCGWARRRLPTEAEWEKAARGTDGRIYPWGNSAPDQNKLNFNSNVVDTTEAGKYQDGKSFYGVLDMVGNVWEWVSDWYDESYYSKSPARNPKGPASGAYRSVRGGAWIYGVSDVRASNRYWLSVSYANYFSVGFRCAATP